MQHVFEECGYIFRLIAIAIVEPIPDILWHSDLRVAIKDVRNVCERSTVFVEDITVAEIVLGGTHIAEGPAFECLCRVVWLIDVAGVLEASGILNA
jgi:hypothetical protein